MEKIYENIRKIRTVKGFSQQNMADELKMSQRNYGRIENGDIDVSYNTLCKIADALNVKVIHLIGSEELMIFNNFNQPQKDGHFNAYNATDIEQVTKLYERLVSEKENVIQSQQQTIDALKLISKGKK